MYTKTQRSGKGNWAFVCCCVLTGEDEQERIWITFGFIPSGSGGITGGDDENGDKVDWLWFIVFGLQNT